MDIHSKYSHSKISLFKKREWDYIAACLTAILIYCIAVFSFGQGITYDSVEYLSGALSIGDGMKKSDGTPFYEWPPLYPAILSISSLFSIDILLFSNILHCIVFAINILLSIYILSETIKNRIIYAAAILILLVSTPLLQVHILIWSEPVFITLILVNIIFLNKYLHDDSIKNFAFLILTGILMCLQRRTGLFFCIATCAVILLYNYKKIFYLVLYFIITTAPLALVYKKKKEATGELLNSKPFDWNSIYDNILGFFNTFTSYFLPSQLPLSFRIIAIFIFGLFLFYFILKQRMRFSGNSYFKVLNFHFLSYFILLLVGLSFIRIGGEVDDRVLSPVYIPYFLSIFIILDKLIEVISENKSLRIMKLFSIILLFFWILYPAGRSIYHIHRWNTAGTGGYNTLEWKKNEIINYVLTHNLSSKEVYTNNVQALSYHLILRNKIVFKIIPQKNLMENKPALLVCLEKEWDYPHEECISENLKNKILLEENKDGKIWMLTKK